MNKNLYYLIDDRLNVTFYILGIYCRHKNSASPINFTGL